MNLYRVYLGHPQPLTVRALDHEHAIQKAIAKARKLATAHPLTLNRPDPMKFNFALTLL